ncbi:MAG TPA: oxygenase MpaB family protein, partial [Terriglobales bacterium]
LRSMGARISTAEADGYVYAWSAVGRLLGIDEALLTWNESEALPLATRIGARQLRATPEGKLLADQLMAAVATLFPIPGYANILAHYFLQNTVFGEDVARVLDLPKPDWTRALVAARAWQKRQILKLLDVVPSARRRRSFLARRFVQNMLLARRPDGTPPFEVPDAFARRWRMKQSLAKT